MTARRLALLVAIASAQGCLWPGFAIDVSQESYKVTALHYEGYSTSDPEPQLAWWDDRGCVNVELNWRWMTSKKKDFWLGGFRLRRYEGNLAVYGVPYSPIGTIDCQEFDFIFAKQVRQAKDHDNSWSFGIRFADLPTWDGGVDTTPTFSFFITGSATALKPLGKSPFSLGVGVDGRFDYIASISAGWHAELVLNAEKGSRVVRYSSDRSSYLAVGYRYMGTTHFFVIDPDVYTTNVQLETSGYYIASTLRW